MTSSRISLRMGVIVFVLACSAWVVHPGRMKATRAQKPSIAQIDLVQDPRKEMERGSRACTRVDLLDALQQSEATSCTTNMFAKLLLAFNTPAAAWQVATPGRKIAIPRNSEALAVRAPCAAMRGGLPEADLEPNDPATGKPSFDNEAPPLPPIDQGSSGSEFDNSEASDIAEATPTASLDADEEALFEQAVQAARSSIEAREAAKPAGTIGMASDIPAKPAGTIGMASDIPANPAGTIGMASDIPAKPAGTIGMASDIAEAIPADSGTGPDNVELEEMALPAGMEASDIMQTQLMSAEEEAMFEQAAQDSKLSVATRAAANTLGWGAAPAASSSPEDLVANDNPKAVCSTTMGDFELELFLDRVPRTVSNFIDLAESGFYDGIHFHRVIPQFMAQFGCPYAKDPTSLRAGTGAPQDGEFMNLKTGEMEQRFAGGCIEDENISPDSNYPGTVSMANTGDPNSGGSQFFINVVHNEGLDWFSPGPSKHPVFGRITTPQGRAVVKKITEVETNKKDRPFSPIMMKSITIFRDQVSGDEVPNAESKQAVIERLKSDFRAAGLDEAEFDKMLEKLGLTDTAAAEPEEETVAEPEEQKPMRLLTREEADKFAAEAQEKMKKKQEAMTQALAAIPVPTKTKEEKAAERAAARKAAADIIAQAARDDAAMQIREIEEAQRREGDAMARYENEVLNSFAANKKGDEPVYQSAIKSILSGPGNIWNAMQEAAREAREEAAKNPPPKQPDLVKEFISDRKIEGMWKKVDEAIDKGDFDEAERIKKEIDKVEKSKTA